MGGVGEGVMSFTEAVFEFIKRRNITLSLMVVYFILWVLFFYSRYSPEVAYDEECGDPSLIGIIILSLVFNITIFVISIVVEDPLKRKDNKIVLGLALIPIIIFLTIFFSTANVL